MLGPGVSSWLILCWRVTAEVLVWQSSERQPLGVTVASATSQVRRRLT